MKFQWKKATGKMVPDHPDNPVMPTPYACKVHTVSETGPTRQANEDSVFYSYPDGHFQTFFGIVADGMGGHQAGEVASSIACETAIAFIQNHVEETGVPSTLEACIQAAQTAILAAAEQNSMYKGMGTTATMIFIRNAEMYFAHVGDSRLYQFRHGKLTQCTSDHTLVNEMLKERKITQEEALNHEMKHVLTQALGTVREVRPELATTGQAVEPGDVFFLCSDGIYDVLQPEEIERLLNMGSSELALECIKALCMQRVASDNFTAMLVEITNEQRLQVPVTKELNIML